MYAAARTSTWPVSYYVANMDAVRAQLRRPPERRQRLGRLPVAQVRVAEELVRAAVVLVRGGDLLQVLDRGGGLPGFDLHVGEEQPRVEVFPLYQSF